MQAQSREVRMVERRPRVLVVDDDDDLRWLLDLELRLRHYDVSMASNGAAALFEVWRQRPDVVLLDLMMPRLGGPGFLRWLGSVADPPPPVVIYSALAGRSAEARRPANVLAVLRKPSPFERVMEAIARAVDPTPGA